jgi:hypothetical protein
MLNAADESEDILIRVQGIENYEIGVSNDEEQPEEESSGGSDESEQESDSDATK